MGLLLRGTQLRYVLTLTLFERGIMTLDELVKSIAEQGFSVNGRASKTLSDALRWEVRRGRVWPRGRARYGPADMPRSTEYRIEKRVRELRDEARGPSRASPDPHCRSEAGNPTPPSAQVRLGRM